MPIYFHIVNAISINYLISVLWSHEAYLAFCLYFHPRYLMTLHWRHYGFQKFFCNFKLATLNSTVYIGNLFEWAAENIFHFWISLAVDISSVGVIIYHFAISKWHERNSLYSLGISRHTFVIRFLDFGGGIRFTAWHMAPLLVFHYHKNSFWCESIS